MSKTTRINSTPYIVSPTPVIGTTPVAISTTSPKINPTIPVAISTTSPKINPTTPKKLPITNKVVIMCIIATILIISVWSSYIIFNNPYTYPTRFWLYFLLGLLAYIITLMIDNLTNFNLLDTFEYVILALTIVFNLFIIINTYTKYLNIPIHIVNITVFMTGFIILYTLNFIINFSDKTTPTTTTTTTTATTPATVTTLASTPPTGVQNRSNLIPDYGDDYGDDYADDYGEADYAEQDYGEDYGEDYGDDYGDDNAEQDYGEADYGDSYADEYTGQYY